MYDKKPKIELEGFVLQGWDKIISFISAKNNNSTILIIDCYAGINENELKFNFEKIKHKLLVDTNKLFKTEKKLISLTDRFMTTDVLFGNFTHLSLIDYFDARKLMAIRDKIRKTKGTIIIMGVGASLVEKGNIHIFADMPRWEIQQRMRRKEVKAIGIDNREDAFSLQYKRGYFNDWKMMDKHKRNVYTKVDFWLDSTENNKPKLINRNTFFAGMEKAASSPFRVVPFFDPAPWGGKWMMEVCDLDRSKINFGWCFDCVPEENSLLLSVNNVEFEMPSVNLVYTKSKELLGEPVEARFGKEFPIRFDFLDTMDGGNLSVQVHPTTQFAIENFGLTYTQDESYYLMDAKEDAHVFLGVKTGVNNIEMLNELEKTQIEKEYIFDVEKYVNCIPTKKHDHFLIPAGTIHCSGKNSMVLEISSTPNIFTFKLWDWNRMGLDGKPRPVNITRGKEVIQWNRNTEYVHKQLVNQFTIVAEGNGWREEKTGLHPTEFIETRRHWFSTQVKHQTNNSVNVLNLVEGACVIVESPSNAFLPFILHYAETFIVPAAVEEYTIRPYGESEGKECATIKAYIKF